MAKAVAANKEKQRRACRIQRGRQPQGGNKGKADDGTRNRVKKPGRKNRSAKNVERTAGFSGQSH
ncbi:hypothetical protein DWUX_2454 [Desulfovibrio diazotrophicus]|nr:hypothetical protein DWUX_2454 [Desulfovibrio diazotrophicus]